MNIYCYKCLKLNSCCFHAQISKNCPRLPTTNVLSENRRFFSRNLKWLQNVHILFSLFILAATRSSDLGPGQVRLGCFYPVSWVFCISIHCQEKGLLCGTECNVAWLATYCSVVRKVLWCDREGTMVTRGLVCGKEWIVV
jgi:hypothetical protein